MKKIDNRFQYQTALVKFWRLRWYLLTPYFCYLYWRTKNFSLEESWGCALGEVCLRMKWWFTAAEMEKE